MEPAKTKKKSPLLVVPTGCERERERERGSVVGAGGDCDIRSYRFER